MPPCALAELQDWSDPFVASATRAPACSAEAAAARPEAPLPITSTSKVAAATTRRWYQFSPNSSHYFALFRSRMELKSWPPAADDGPVTRVFSVLSLLAALAIGGFMLTSQASKRAQEKDA